MANCLVCDNAKEYSGEDKPLCLECFKQKSQLYKAYLEVSFSELKQKYGGTVYAYFRLHNNVSEKQ